MSRPKFKDLRLGAQLASAYLSLGKVEAIRLLRDLKPGESLASDHATINHYLPDQDAAESAIRDFKETQSRIPQSSEIREL